MIKGLPRIPFAFDFKAFERAGRKLADIHLNYENQALPRNVEIWRDGKKVRLDKLSAEDLRVEKIRENKRDRSEIFFNQRVALKSIPKEVWDYKIGEWSAVKHVIERYRYKVDKDSRIVNDPNSYSDDPRYVLNLLLSVISVSLKSLDIIKGLPALNIEGVDQSLDEVA